MAGFKMSLDGFIQKFRVKHPKWSIVYDVSEQQRKNILTPFLEIADNKTYWGFYF